MNVIFQQGRLLILIFILWMFFSCKNGPPEIPLPENSEFPQPVTTAFHISDSGKIIWPEHFTRFTPVIRNFDVEKLPSRIFDSAGFSLLAKKPEEFKFNLQQLKDTAFNYGKLPSKPLHFESFLNDPPKIFKAPHPYLKKGTASMIYEFGETEGLIGTYINSLLVDKDGFIWLATELGIYRYDGENFLKYLSVSPEWTVLSMIEDKKGNIWVGTFGNNNREGVGIVILNTSSSIVKRLTAAQGLVGNNIIGMTSDDHGRIWVSTFPRTSEPDGINIIDENEQVIKQFNIHQGLSLNFVRSFLKDNDNKIWIATRGGGIDIVDLEKGRISYLRKENGLINDSINSLSIDRMNRIWASTRRGYIQEIDVKGGIIRQFGKDQGLGVHYTCNILCDQKGMVWIGTFNSNGDLPGNGIEIIDPEKGAIKIINASGGLNSNDVYRIERDNLGQIWLATSAGLNFLNKGGNNLSHTGNNEITAIAEDPAGKMWIAYGFSKGVHGMEILDTKTGISRILNSKSGLVNDSLQTLLVQNGKIWIATNGGIDIVDSSSKTITHLYGKEILQSSTPTGMFIAGDGKLWLGKSTEPEVDILDMKKNTIGHLGISINRKDTIVTDIKQDKQGRIWLATFSGGVYILEPEKNAAKYIGIKKLTESRFSKFLMPDDQNNMWISSGNGIFIVNANLDSVTHISTKEGLINESIISLNKFKGLIYAGTRGGVSVIRPPDLSADKKWDIESFGKSVGFNKLANTIASDFMGSDGRFLWGDNGLTQFTIHSEDRAEPETHVTAVDIFNQPQYFTDKSWSQLTKSDTLWSPKKDTFYVKGQLQANTLYPQLDKMQWDSVTSAYNMPVNLHLAYYQNYLQFHFAKNNPGSNDTSWYRYILLGIDKKWSEKTFNGFSQNYLDLSPGEYVFRVSGLHSGKWTQPAEFRFTILPPWWQTWWAYVLDFLAVSGLAWAFARYRSSKLKKENQMLEEKIKQRTNQLQQSLEELKTTQTQLIQSEKMASLGELTAGIAHEIQNPLNFVNNFSEVNLEMNAELREKLNGLSLNSEDRKELDELMTNIDENEKKIIHHGKRADAIVKSMLLHSRNNTGHKVPTDINALADEYFRLSYHGIRARDKSFNAKMVTSFDPALGKVDVIPNDLGRVFLNLYNNAFYAVADKKKHNPAGYEPTVSVSTKRLNGSIEIGIKDNGIGISQRLMDKIFQPFFTTKPTGQGTGLGLSLSYDTIKAHGGDLRVETREGEGAEFIVQIPAI